MTGTVLPLGDSWRQARREMVSDQIRARGVCDLHLLNAMNALPRERFIPSAMRDQAYADRAVPIGHDQTISQPYIVARMTEALNLQPGHRVLDVGTGSGYQAALLSLLGARVFSIERIADLSTSAAATLTRLGIQGPDLMVGDGSLGCPSGAPFDGILVAAGANRVPASLLDQLKENGRIVIPIGRAGLQILVVIQRRDGRTIETPILSCRFVKLIGAQAWGSRRC